MRTPCKFLMFFLAMPMFSGAQPSLDSVLETVKANNKTLKYERLQMEAAMRLARTGIYLPNPEVQFDYLWGDPAASGNRVDFGITQEFEFPWVYIQRASRSGLIRTGSSLSYLEKEREILHRTRLTWIGLVSLNREISLTRQRVGLATDIAQKAALQLSRGDISAIGNYHARLEAVNLKRTLTDLEMERASLQSMLTELCGGSSPVVGDTVYPPSVLPALKELEANLADLPAIRLMENEIRLMQSEKNLAVQEWFPRFKAGYYSETVTGLRYQGIVTGISIPLWEKSNTVTNASVRAKKAEAGLEVVTLQQLARIRSLWDRQQRLAAQVSEIRTALYQVNLPGLLMKALESGEMTISGYFYESAVYYSALLGLVKTEQELAETEADLKLAAGF